jgi:glycosyltransferase involved in cell wall biosynthesis
MENKTLSIIIPCLNEEKNISNVVIKLHELLITSNISYEIVIIDDQSDDNTFHIAKSLKVDKNLVVIKKDLERRGYGAVIKYGIANASGFYVTFVSADLVDPIHLIPKMYYLLKNKKYDLVQCSRYLNPKNSKTIPMSYKFFQYFFRIFVRLIFEEKIADSTYAFKMFDKKKILSLGLSSNRFNISPEIFFKAKLANYKIIYLPGSQSYRLNGQSKFYFSKEGVGFFYTLLRAFLHKKRLIFWF